MLSVLPTKKFFMNLSVVLKNYGLNEKQAKIYLACLELGSASVSKISKLSGLARSACYEILEVLKTQGLISTFQKKKIKWFSAEDPHLLVHRAKDKTNLLEAALPQFLQSYGQVKNRPNIRFYDGVEGMKNILEEILKETKSEVLNFSSVDDLYAVLGDKFFKEYVVKRLAKKISAKVILRESPMAYQRQRLGPKQLREVRFIPAAWEFHGITLIWENKIAMFSLQKNLAALVIESSELSKMMKTMFYLIWNQLPPYRSN